MVGRGEGRGSSLNGGSLLHCIKKLLALKKTYNYILVKLAIYFAKSIHLISFLPHSYVWISFTNLGMKSKVILVWGEALKL